MSRRFGSAFLTAGTTPAMESFGVPSISLEDEEVAIDEALQAGEEIPADLSEASRVIEVADAMEDLAAIADTIEAATPAEVAMAEVVGNAAVAGTDIAPEQIVPTLSGTEEVVVDGEVVTPATESFAGKKIATEGIRETAKRLWENIQKFLANMWAKIQLFFTNIIYGLKRIQGRIDSVKKRADEAKELGGKKFEYGAGLHTLSVSLKAVSSPAELQGALGEFKHATNYVFGEYASSVAKVGGDLSKAIKTFDATKPAECVKEISALVGKVDFGFPYKQAEAKGRYPMYTVLRSPDLLGNVALSLRKPKEVGSEGDLAVLDVFRNSQVSLVTGTDSIRSGYNTMSAISMTTLSKSEVTKVLDTCSEIIKTVSEFRNGSKYKALQTAKDEMKAASAEATKSMEKSEDKSNGSAGAYRAALNFNYAFSYWTAGPTVAMLKHAVKVVNASVSLVSKSIDADGAVVKQ